MLLEDPQAQTREAQARRALAHGVDAPSPRHRSSTARAPQRRRLLINLLTLAVTLVFSYIALSSIKLDQVWSALRSSDYWWLIPALLVFAAGNVARALRWRSLFAHGRRPPLGTVANAMMIGYLYNNILPARAGEAARVVVLTKRSSTAPVEIVGTVVLERIYDLVAVLVIFFVAEPWLPHVSWFGAAAVAALVLAALIALAATVLAVYGDRPLRLLLRPLKRISLFSGERLENTIEELTHGLSGLRHRGVALEALVWTIAAWMLSALCAYLVSLAFHLHLPFACGVLVVVAVGLGMILPSPPAAVGVFEGAALIALNAYGVSHSAALPYALVLHAVNFVPFVLVGALLVQYNARHPRRSDAVESPVEVAPPAG
ncbi:MAG TPA: lysylphosphatidylglycerol synthase transmembrane domain-containing protein [Solirubrobacteraceae bacterium]|nr:lysylphosphatidylglycerol synthase transmembrane domain-containing protein [Solirubrobacteraceae bacterium]